MPSPSRLSTPRSPRTPPGEPSPDVLVVGAGLVGLFCADALAERGLRVEVWERGAEAEERASPGAPGAASWASAGMLAPLAEVPDDPTFLALCLEARDLWRRVAPELAEASGVDLDYDTTGALLVDRPAAPVEGFERAARAAGERAFRVDAGEARAMVPDLAGACDGPFLFLPGEHRVDNRQVCRALGRRLAARGVAVRGGRRVEEIRPGTGGVTVIAGQHRSRAGRALVTAGAWGGEIAGLPPLPLHPVKGQMLRFGDVDWPLTGCLRAGHHYVARRSRPGRRGLLLGATVEPEAGFDVTVTGDGLEGLLAFARDLLPGLMAKPVTASWAGLRPGSGDGRPLVGPLEDGVFLAGGHYRNGVLLAPWTARLVADWLADGHAPARELAELLAPRRAVETCRDR